ncbi:MAG: class I SAM-dependent methyltransferase [Chloroflexota bacterium]|nr:class I SAM-dependent methyltransferase [Chloroflexota bacterium]
MSGHGHEDADDVGAHSRAPSATGSVLSPQSSVLDFDYEDATTIQGRGGISSTERTIGGLRLRRAFDAMMGHTGSCLLLGCGAGRHNRAIYRERPDLTLVGADLSVSAIREAVQVGNGGAYLVADAAHTPAADASYDIVLLFDLLEHVPDVGRCVAEIARVLKPGGLFHGFIPLEAQPKTLFRALTNSKRIPIHQWKHDHVGHIQRLTTESVTTTYRAHGMEPSDLTYSFHLLGQVHDIVDYWGRERLRREPEGRSATVTKAVQRIVFFPTWRLTYWEDTLLKRNPWATGLHLTAIKRG